MRRIFFLIIVIAIVSAALVLLLENISERDISERIPVYSSGSIVNSFEDLSDSVILITEKNFSIFDASKPGAPKYIYEIYSNSGDLVERETVTRSFPTITSLSDSLLSIEIGVGTGTWRAQYYDSDRDILSEIFDSPIAVINGKTAYFTVSNDIYKLVVRDIFNESEYYKEHILDLSRVANPIDALVQVEYLDGDRLQVTYRSGSNYDNKSSTIQF